MQAGKLLEASTPVLAPKGKNVGTAMHNSWNQSSICGLFEVSSKELHKILMLYTV